jgi:hypothetical protein
MPQNQPGFAIAVRVARRALAERIAAISGQDRVSIGIGAVTFTDTARIIEQRTRLSPLPLQK